VSDRRARREAAESGAKRDAASRQEGVVPAEASITLEEVQEHPVLSAFIAQADRQMDGMGFTEHGFRHAKLTGRIAFNVLDRLSYDARTATLGSVAGYLHDVGNCISRTDHGQTGAVLVNQLLGDRVEASDLAVLMGAIGNHEEEYGHAVGPVAAAVILADKSDVHRSRVRKADQIEFDIHDRVNYAVEESFLRVDADAGTITLELTIDTSISHVMEYFEIFLDRMAMCRRAAEELDCRFRVVINETEVL
jgi:metal-dependent HD superfamily phosphatase/phosphodiesterase